MKILVYYTPRSCSTWVHNALAKHFALDPWYEILVNNRRASQSYDRYPELINSINSTDNICVKLSSNDFVNIRDCVLREDYKDIDYASFDRIVVTTRNDVLSAVLSYAYMNMADRTDWHTQPGTVKQAQSYTADLNKVYYLLRGYAMAPTVIDYIKSQVSPDRINFYEYSTVKTQLVKDFNLSESDLETNISANNLDYSELAVNSENIAAIVGPVLAKMRSEINNPTNFFWQYRQTIL